MSANVETMFSANGERPWHQIGTVIQEETVNSEQAIKLAGLDWNVFLADIRSDFGEITNKKAVIRDTDNSCLGVVGNKYVPFQNIESFTFMDEVLGDYGARYETAGSLFNGKKVWIIAKLPDELVINGDSHEKYLLLSNGHDGLGTIKITFTSVRVVCWNTLCMAMQNCKNTFSIKHTKNASMKVEEAKQILQLSKDHYDAMGVMLKVFRDMPINHFQMKDIANKVFNENKKQTERLSELFYNGVGNCGKTAYDLVNAATEYDTYYSRGK